MTSYTAYALTTHGPAVIECYPSLAAAVADMLGLWPEDPESDVRIVDGRGRDMAHLRHGAADPALCTLTFDDRDGDATYRCEYVTGPTGRVRTVAWRVG
jgi:hypothetical protein